MLFCRCPYSRHAIQRAIVNRNKAAEVHLPSGYRVNIPELYQSQSSFCHSKEAVLDENIACGRSIKLVPCSSGKSLNLHIPILITKYVSSVFHFFFK